MFLFFQDLSLGSRLAGAPCGMLHPNGGPAEGHPGSDPNHQAAQRQPRRLPKAQHAALHPGRAPRVAQVRGNIEAFVIHAGASDPRLTSSTHLFPAATSESVWSWTRTIRSASATTSRWRSWASSWIQQRSWSSPRGRCFLWCFQGFRLVSLNASRGFMSQFICKQLWRSYW